MFRYQVTTKICESDIDDRFLKDNDRIVFVIRSVGFSANTYFKVGEILHDLLLRRHSVILDSLFTLPPYLSPRAVNWTINKSIKTKRMEKNFTRVNFVFHWRVAAVIEEPEVDQTQVKIVKLYIKLCMVNLTVPNPFH